MLETAAAVEVLYETFSSYRIEHPSKVGFFDFGPNEAELLAISGPLRGIPMEVVRSMEFFAVGWGSWGSEVEVKYVLPRVLECLAAEPDLLQSPSTMSLFKYKLRRGLSVQGTALLSWEREPVARFMELLLEQQLASEGRPSLGFLVEALVELRFDWRRARAALDREPERCQRTAKALRDHFGWENGDGSPRGVYSEHQAGIRDYTDWAHAHWPGPT